MNLSIDKNDDDWIFYNFDDDSIVNIEETNISSNSSNSSSFSSHFSFNSIMKEKINFHYKRSMQFENQQFKKYVDKEINIKEHNKTSKTYLLYFIVIFNTYFINCCCFLFGFFVNKNRIF